MISFASPYAPWSSTSPCLFFFSKSPSTPKLVDFVAVVKIVFFFMSLGTGGGKPWVKTAKVDTYAELIEAAFGKFGYYVFSIGTLLVMVGCCVKKKREKKNIARFLPSHLHKNARRGRTGGTSHTPYCCDFLFFSQDNTPPPPYAAAAFCHSLWKPRLVSLVHFVNNRVGVEKSKN